MKFKNKILLIIVFISGLLHQSCVTKKQVLYLQDSNVLDVSKISLNQNTLQENDILKIDVTSQEIKASVYYNKPISNLTGGQSIDMMQLNGYLVSSNETINFPVLGEINVSGKTIFELEKHIRYRLETEGHLIKPNVSIRLLNGRFTILGEVRQPGTYNYIKKNITLLQAIGLAGDLTIEGNRQDVTIIREFKGERVISKVDLTSASFLSGNYQNILPNDVIIVNPNLKKIKSAGLLGNISTALSIASILLSTIILIR